MSERKFKVGDRVKCVNELEYRGKGLKDKHGTVMHDDGLSYAVKFEDWVDGHPCSWDGLNLGRSGWYCKENMLDFASADSIVIYQKGNEVFAKNTITGEIAKATCHKDDTFDFAIGAKLALERLLPTETKVSYVKQDEYEIGDIVKIRDWDDMVAEFGTVRTFLDNVSINSEIRYSDGQKKYCGNEYKIDNRIKRDGKFIYTLDDCFLYIFTKDHFVGKRVEETDTKKPEEPKYQPGDIIRLTEDYMEIPKGAMGVIVDKHPVDNRYYAVDFKFRFKYTHNCGAMLEKDTGYFLTDDSFEKVE